MRRSLLAAVVPMVLAVPARAERVRAAHAPSAAMAWGVTTGELATAGVFYLNFGTDLIPNHGPALAFNFTPMVLAPGVAYLARNADPRPALAIHGAGWLGLDLFLLGTLIDGRADTHRMKIGPRTPSARRASRSPPPPPASPRSSRPSSRASRSPAASSAVG